MLPRRYLCLPALCLGVVSCAPQHDAAPRGASASASASTSVVAAASTTATTPPKPAVAALKKALSERYAYRDRLGVDWNQRVDARAAELAEAPPERFAEIVQEILSVAKDTHISVEAPGGKRLNTFTPQPVMNFSLAALEREVQDWKPRTKCLVTGRLGDYGYLLITHFVKERCGELGADFSKLLIEMGNMKGLVLDVRANSGGDEMLARSIAGRFVDDKTVYAKHAFVAPNHPSGFGPVEERSLEPIAPRFDKPVVVLTGPLNMSSCESFLLMMRAAGKKLIGEPSSGASGNPQPHELGNGVKVYLPSWKALRLDGSALEGVGIAPDILVDTQPSDFEKGEPVFEAAKKELSR